MNTAHEEERVGHAVDIACLRKYPQVEVAERAHVHSTGCALMGHCIESGYGLVDEQGRVLLLDAEATAGVVAAVKGSGLEKGVRLRVRHRREGHAMKTVSVDPLPGENQTSDRPLAP